MIVRGHRGADTEDGTPRAGRVGGCDAVRVDANSRVDQPLERYAAKDASDTVAQTGKPPVVVRQAEDTPGE